uniref:Uncharacterized protein n=1 Tax=Aegilops tauschii subsp. strangulata TaxID=200361 RepID=A0A453RC47_AEGTS
SRTPTHLAPRKLSLTHARESQRRRGQELGTREVEAEECRAGEWEVPVPRRTPDERGGCGAPARSAAPPAAGRHFWVSALVQAFSWAGLINAFPYA